MNIKVLECPVCGSKNTLSFLKCTDYTVSQETFQLDECRDCSFKFTQNIPSASDIAPYYKSEDYVSHSSSGKGLINKLYLLVRKYSLNQKFKLVNSLTFGNSLLDYGSGTGHFLAVCKENAWEVSGFELSEDARKFSKEVNQVDSRPIDQLENVPDNSQDIITMWHVLEHVHELKPTLNTLYNKLKPGGKIIIAVPNCNSYDAFEYKSFWAAYDVPRHLYHFTQKSMNVLLNEHCLKHIKTVPMVFDSFYVSLLSEKYKNKGKIGIYQLLKGFITGLQSNIKATRSTEYSSLIYIYQK